MIYKETANRMQVSIHSLEDCIPDDHIVRVLDLFVDKLSNLDFGFKEYDRPESLGGRPAFHWRTLLKIYLYGYYNRMRSSRKLEAECRRNIELQWLTGSQFPNYHTIADFRSTYRQQLQAVFSLFTAFLKNEGLFGKKVMAIDGSKFRAQNSKKENYNEKKVKQLLVRLEQKARDYLKEMDQEDEKEYNRLKGERPLSRREIRKKLLALKERKSELNALLRQVKSSPDGQVSKTDPDSRALIINKNIVEVCYNVQTVVDEKHKLITTFETTNRNDARALAGMVHKGCEAMDVDTRKEQVTILADKGYHNGEQLAQCEELNVETLVTPREQPSVKHLEEEFLVSNFTYHKPSDSYTCPAGHRMKTNGKWYRKTHGSNNRHSQTESWVKHYKTPKCKICPLLNRCTKNTRGRGRVIERTQHQDAIDRNNARVTGQKELYNQRQAICEHPFGTIKRQWGYSYTLLKGKEKVNGEMALIFLTYNLRRCVSILSIKELLRRLKNWQPPEGRPKKPSPGRKKKSKSRFLSSLSALINYCRYYPVSVRPAIALRSTLYYLN